MQHELGLHEGTKFSVFIQSAFDTGIIIDTSSFSMQQYREHVARTISLLQQSYQEAKWTQEYPRTIHGADDAIDFLPILNFSYVTAICSNLLTHDSLEIKVSGGAVCTVKFLLPTVYFHPFGAGIISVEALLYWNQPYTLNDLRTVNDQLLRELGPLVEASLAELIRAFAKTVHTARIPLYTPPFSDLLPAALDRNVLYWSHFAYVARVASTVGLSATAAWLNPLMMPMDQRPINNMALKPDRYIYFGWGRSIICCLTTLDDKTIYSYVRILEIRNYLWKTLYDLDRGLRSAIIRMRNIHSDREAHKLEASLRALDFRVKGILEELDSFKLTFDHEKIWLIKQLDINWLTNDLMTSLQTRLQSFCDFYDYIEESTRRMQEEHLQWVLNLIGVLAAAGTITAVVTFFDPFNHLFPQQRAEFLVTGVVSVALMFFVAIATVRRVRHKD